VALPRGPNLAIITNAGGPAALATDALMSMGGKLAELNEDTMSALNGFLPASWSKSNPIDIIEDADPQRYSKAVEITIKDPGVDGAVVIYAPQGATSPTEIAKAIIPYAKKSKKPVIAALLGDAEVSRGRQLFYQSNVPTYEFPEEAVRTYLYMNQYARNLEMLYETPEDMPLDIGAPKNYLKVMVGKNLMRGETLLTEAASKKFLSTYRICCTTPHVAKNPKDAVTIASAIGYPVAMKLSSPDVTHKSGVGGVRLNISSDDEVKQAFGEIMGNVEKHKPDAKIEGVSVQEMIPDYDYELIIGSKKDPIFGPVIMFGLGGTEAEFFKDIAVGLPPLNRVLARRLIEQTRIYKALSEGFRNKPPANLTLLEETLVRVSSIVTDFPEIKEIDINPLVMSGNAAVALDARIVLDEKAIQKEMGEYSHLIISPYHTKYIEPWRLRDGRSVLLRPIRPEDELLERELIAGLSQESSRFRFFYVIREMTHNMLTRFCNIDYDREIAIMAEYTSNGKRRSVGVSSLIIQPGGETAEFAILVADDFQNNGLGLKLLDILIGIAQEKGLKSIYATVLPNNKKMMSLARKLGMTIERLSPEESKLTFTF
jgi:acetyltransferase